MAGCQWSFVLRGGFPLSAASLKNSVFYDVLTYVADVQLSSFCIDHRGVADRQSFSLCDVEATGHVDCRRWPVCSSLVAGCLRGGMELVGF